MTLSPQRRRRALQAHQLRQQGLSLRQIAQHLQLSRTAVHNDLRALETQRPQLIQALADDKLLDHAQRLEQRLDQLLSEHPLSKLERFLALNHDGQVRPLNEILPPEQIARFVDIHERAIRTALAEYRATLRDLRASTRNRLETTPAADDADYPNAELADPEPPADAPASGDQTLTGVDARLTEVDARLTGVDARLTKVDTAYHPQPPNQPQTPAKHSEIAIPPIPTPPASTPAVNLTRQQRRQAQRQAERESRKARKRANKARAAA